MAARDRYSYEVKCPQCGQIGVFHVSEDDHPYMRNPHRAVDKIDGDFTASVNDGIEIRAVCSQCNSAFKP
jgi:phage FluMu protein Com